MGAGCTVDRAKFGNTVIGAGTKMDNLVHIAHNVMIGKCCLLAGMAGVSGSSKLGDGVVMAGQSGISDNITVGDGAMLGGKCAVLRDVPKGGRVFGIPAVDANQEMRNHVHIRRLPKMSKTLKELVKKVERLEASEDNKQ
jgi:UDP-3-O-[3-hydroxymyristoyl] glucosamine N-acyltransferase